MPNLSDRVRRFVSLPWVPPYCGVAPYFWPLSFGFFLWKYFYITPSVLEIGCLLLSIVTFLPVYFVSFWASGRLTLFCVLYSCLFGVLWAPVNFGASTFFIFACAMCSGIESRRGALALVAGVLLLATVVFITRGEGPLAFIVPVWLAGVPVGISSMADVRQRRSNEQLLRKQEEVEHMATIAERERISRDLHDLLGHTLSLITLKAELAGKLVARDPDACQREIKDIEKAARHALSEVRSAVTGYRQTGFAYELDGARASLAAAQVVLDVQLQPCTLSAAVESVMALALREAVTNIVRHAQASRCVVHLSEQDDVTVLRIEDDGKALSSGARIQHGNGLTGMRERVAALSGELAIVVANGVTLEMRLPKGAKP
jgi:two-component system sensor histidine kinase DesK